MTDTAKRRTLKGLAAAAAGTATVGFSSSSMASDINFQALNPQGVEDHLAVQTRLSSQTNDIEAVFYNAGDQTLSIDALTPHEITTFRGKFNIKALTANEPLVLAPGESVSVGIQRHDSSLYLNENIRQGQSLSRALQASASAVSTTGKPIPIRVNQTQFIA